MDWSEVKVVRVTNAFPVESVKALEEDKFALPEVIEKLIVSPWIGLEP
jgi:hypothetical protein